MYRITLKYQYNNITFKRNSNSLKPQNRNAPPKNGLNKLDNPTRATVHLAAPFKKAHL